MARILILEDDYSLLRLYTKTLRTEGHTVISTATAQAAYEMFERHQFDLCISDIRVGGTDPEVLIAEMAQVRQQQHVEVMMMSSSMEFYEGSCQQAGLQHTVAKPISHARLRRLVKALLADLQRAPLYTHS